LSWALPSEIHISARVSSRARCSSMRLEARNYLYDLQETAGL
jgi:hypothetical protein